MYSRAEELTDRLVTAIEEGDVLYVLVWIEEMERRGCLEHAINAKPKYAQLLITLGTSAACDWIDALSLSPEDFSALTGNGPLPNPPPPVSPASPSGPPSDFLTSPNFNHPSPLSSSSSIISKEAQPLHTLYFDEQDPPSSSSSDQQALPSSSSRITLGVARFPLDYKLSELSRLFLEKDIPCRVLHIESSTIQTYAFVEVEERVVEQVITSFDHSDMDGRKLRVFVSSDIDEQIFSALGITPTMRSEPLLSPTDLSPQLVPLSPSLSSPPSPPPLPPASSAPETTKKSDLRPLLIFGLPLQTTRSQFHKFAYAKLSVRQLSERRCSVAILEFDPAKSEEIINTCIAASCEAKWKLVYKGTEDIEQTIEDWFEGKVEKSRIFDRTWVSTKRPFETDSTTTNGKESGKKQRTRSKASMTTAQYTPEILPPIHFSFPSHPRIEKPPFEPPPPRPQYTYLPPSRAS
ncbi:uncharacterized protein JCM6883_005850 [Sporobolomyces salmoneus]|uniref:uncharacterized protein n=1 Tax=Sporobolomyces salmoneus TaxID=183962 RepID=UPI00317395DD